MKKLKNEGGITLVALVITIVVLIILAAVTINMTVGENGLFTKAKLARDNYLIAANEEMVGLAQLEAELENANKPYYVCLYDDTSIILLKSGETTSEDQESTYSKAIGIDSASYIDKDGAEHEFASYVVPSGGGRIGININPLNTACLNNIEGMENIKIILKKDGNSYDITVPVSLFPTEEEQPK